MFTSHETLPRRRLETEPVSPVITIRVRTDSPTQTVELGKSIGEALKGGDVVLLEGELGAGKTILARGICIGAGMDEKTPVRSPTFTLMHEYTGRAPIRHADLYRIENDEDLETVGLFDPGEDEAPITIIEWADRLPEERRGATVRIKITDVSETSRELEITGPQDLLAGAGLCR